MSKLRVKVGTLAALIATAALLIPAAASAAESTSYAKVLDMLSREIPKVMRSEHAVGLSIALVDGERTVWARGFGSADRATKTPATAETLFHIGSTSKTLTAVALMQLVEEGRVDLDAPLSRYLPQFKILPRFPGSVVTVRSVLDMHSGIPGDVGNGLITEGQPYPEYNSSLLRTLAKSYPERPVDTIWAYSSSSFVLLQDLVENVSGQSFVSYTRERLFEPMGMDRTTFDDSAPSTGELARAYQAWPGADGAVRVVAQPREFVNGRGTGSVVTTAPEMAAYLKTLIAGGATPSGNRILSRSALREMTTPQTDLPLDITSFKAGLGWTIGDTGNKWMGHAIWWNGATANFHTFFRWLPRLGLGAFVSVNTTSAVQVSEEVGLRALGLMVTAKTGRSAPAPSRPAPVVEVPTKVLRRAAGQYASSSTGLYTVSLAGDGLKLTPTPPVPGVSPVKYLPRADGWYAPQMSPDDPWSSEWIKPATVAGRHLLLAHLNYIEGPEPNGVVTTYAEKLPADYRIPRAWRARTGSYRATNIVPGNWAQTPRTGELRIVDGVLEWNGLVVTPEGPDLGFTTGLSPWFVARGAGKALVPSGKTLTIFGVHYRKVDG